MFRVTSRRLNINRRTVIGIRGLRRTFSIIEGSERPQHVRETAKAVADSGKPSWQRSAWNKVVISKGSVETLDSLHSGLLTSLALARFGQGHIRAAVEIHQR